MMMMLMDDDDEINIIIIIALSLTLTLIISLLIWPPSTWQNLRVSSLEKRRQLSKAADAPLQAYPLQPKRTPLT